MKLIINGKSEEIAGSKLTVSKLLAIKNVEMPEMVTVELNSEIVERTEYGSRTVKNGDTIEFLYFMGGGSPTT